MVAHAHREAACHDLPATARVLLLDRETARDDVRHCRKTLDRVKTAFGLRGGFLD